MGAGNVLRSGVAKVAGIGAVNAGHRGLPASARVAASQSLGRNAAAARDPSATLSAQGISEEAVMVALAAVQWNQWNIDDWAEVMAVVHEGSGKPMPRVIFGGAPSLEETMAATNELKDALDMIYLSNSEDKVLESVDSAISNVASGAVTTYALPNLAVHACKLLSQNPAVQDVVSSIVSDPNVWNAFRQNDALKDFMRSQISGIQFPQMDHLMSGEYVDDAASEDWTFRQRLKKWMSPNYEKLFIPMFHEVKVTAVELVSDVSSFLHYFFNPPEAEKGPADRVSAGSAGIERTMGGVGGTGHHGSSSEASLHGSSSEASLHVSSSVSVASLAPPSPPPPTHNPLE